MCVLCPTQVLGPRHGHLSNLGLLSRLAGSGGVVDLSLLVMDDDVEWCTAMGVPVLDYSKYKAHWEEEYTQVRGSLGWGGGIGIGYSAVL